MKLNKELKVIITRYIIIQIKIKFIASAIFNLI